MELTERVLLFATGAFVGFIFGWMVASIRDIKEELDRVDTATTGEDHTIVKKNRFRRLSITNLSLIVVVALVAYAAFVSGQAANKSEEALKHVENDQEVIQRITYCNQYFLIETISDLNARTTFAIDQAEANIKLQRAQSRYLEVLLTRPPLPEANLFDALETYFSVLSDFVRLARLTTMRAEENPFATEEEVASCFDGTQIPEPKESTTAD